MVNLKDTEVNNVIKGCQVFTLTEEVMTKEVIRFRKNQKWEEINTKLIERYGIQYKKEIAMLNSLSASAKRHGLRGSQISLDRSAYTAANKLTGQGISYVKTKRFLEAMDNDGLITLYIGYWDVKEEVGVSSFYIIEEEYDEM